MLRFKLSQGGGRYSRMPAIPLPRRGLRSLFVVLSLILCPYILRRQLSSISDPDPRHASSGGWLRATRGVDAPHKRSDDPYDILDIPMGRMPATPDGLVKKKDTKKKKDQVVLDKKKGKSKLPSHTFLENGLMVVNTKGQHPIFDLVDKAQKQWDEKLKTSSKTLGQAVNEYRRRYGRAPPKGFDRWWEYAQENNVQLPDEYDQIHEDLEPFWALPGKQIRSLIKEAGDRWGMYSITCPGYDSDDPTCIAVFDDTGFDEGNRRIVRERVEDQLILLRPIEDLLEDVEAVFYYQDVPWQFVGHEYKSALEDAASVGEYYDTESHDLDWAHLGWASACAPHKPLRKSYDVNTYPDLDGLWLSSEKSFIWDHKKTMDPCIHPELTHLMGFLSGHGKGPGPSKDLYPVMAMCKTTVHSDVLAVSMENWTEDVGDDPEWEDKESDKMLWRGKNTGILFKHGVPWNISQRINLLDRTARKAGAVPVLPITPPHSPVGDAEELSLRILNRDLVDVGFVDIPIQCEADLCDYVRETYVYKGRKDWVSTNKYKYLLDVDGNGWSARFKRQMSTNSLVLKSTIFPEWYNDRIQPWLHYVPVKPDLTDLYDIMTFFHGGHDDMAKKIGADGKKWSKTFWREVDMVSYQFRLFLELSRLMAPNREAASFLATGKELDR